MTITEFAILVFKSPPDFSDPTLRSLFQQLSAWQSDSSGFPLRFYANVDEPCEVGLVTGWTSVAAHEAWIRGARNQELLRVFSPYVDIPRVRMVHVGVDFEAMRRDGNLVVERYEGARWKDSQKTGLEGYAWELVGRDLARVEGDVFRFVGVGKAGESDAGGGASTPVERWVLKGVEL